MKKLKIIFLTIVGLIDFVLCQGEVHLRISIESPTRNFFDFVVTDRYGRKTGTDPRGNKINYDSIPNVFYGYDNSMGVSVTEFLNTIYTPQDDGIWTVEIIGDTVGKFVFYVSADSYEGSQNFKHERNTFVDKDAVLNYKFTYYGTPGSTAKVEKVIAITSLGQDITAGGKLNLVGNQTFVNSLLTQCNQMVNFFNAGNKTQAHSKLNSIKTSIQTAFYNQTGTQFVNDYAYTVLLEDIQLTYALINCATCPMEEARIRK